MIGAALTRLPAHAAVEAEQLSEEELAEEAVLAEEAAEADPDAPGVAEEQEEEPVDEKDVLVLTDSTFDDAIKQNQYILVEFYAPWCGHCQSLKPEYARAATTLKEQGSAVALAKVDATVESSLGQRYAVQGYPTLKWFVDGEPLDYNGGRTSEDILKFVKKKTGPPAQTVSTVAELEKATAASTVYALGYFDALESAEHAAFEAAARATDDVEFVQTTAADVAKAGGLSAQGVAVVSTFEGEQQKAQFSGHLKEREAIREFVKAEKVPPYVVFTEENQDIIFNSGIPINIIMVGSAEQLKKGSALTKAALAAHAKVKGKVIFVLADRAGDAAEPIVEFFGLPRESEEPQVVGFHMETSLKYLFKHPFSEAALVAFAEALRDGTVEPTYKSDEVPTGDDAKDGEVVVVVGKNFDEVVLDEKKDVLLEAYAPWCGHCKQLAPTYKKLAKRFKDVDSVVIAKIDGTTNEHGKIKVEGFPTIMFFPAGKDKTPITYEDGRTLKELTKFVKKSAKISFTLPKKQKEEEEAEDKADEEAQKAAEAAEEEAAESEEGGPDDMDGVELGSEDMAEMGEDGIDIGDVDADGDADADAEDGEHQADEL
jgi:protein disulfide-isomerase A1